VAQRSKTEGNMIPKPQAHNECVVLEKDTFDPDAIFMDDIVDDDVLPKLSLAVDGLTVPGDGNFDLPASNSPPEPVIKPSTRMPVTRLDPDHLEVYGWESSVWKKICGYLGF
jgi:hypothetical protein